MVFLLFLFLLWGIEICKRTWHWIPPQDRGDILGIIRRIINTIIYQYNYKYNQDKLWSNAFKSAFVRNYDYNSNRCCALPNDYCTGGGGIWMFPCGHIYCDDCLNNYYYHHGLKWWNSSICNPFTQRDEYFYIFSCPQQECRQNNSCYITWNTVFDTALFKWNSFKGLANTRSMRRNKDLLISSYLREVEENGNGMMIPTAINGYINRTYTDFYMNP